ETWRRRCRLPGAWHVEPFHRRVVALPDRLDREPDADACRAGDAPVRPSEAPLRRRHAALTRIDAMNHDDHHDGENDHGHETHHRPAVTRRTLVILGGTALLAAAIPGVLFTKGPA